ncbi:hypothetical protein M8J77_025547 [Diaphorina citri]|nr:hypothetical protein M8J77_025547 [Diaphorina citri]
MENLEDKITTSNTMTALQRSVPIPIANNATEEIPRLTSHSQGSVLGVILLKALQLVDDVTSVGRAE